MSDIINNGGPAFPFFKPDENLPGFNSKTLAAKHFPGMTLRQWFATFSPEPTEDEYRFELKQDQFADPHNDHGKRRSRDQIRAYLKFKKADAMIAENEKGTKP